MTNLGLYHAEDPFCNSVNSFASSLLCCSFFLLRLVIKTRYATQSGTENHIGHIEK